MTTKLNKVVDKILSLYTDYSPSFVNSITCNEVNQLVFRLLKPIDALILNKFPRFSIIHPNSEKQNHAFGVLKYISNNDNYYDRINIFGSMAFDKSYPCSSQWEEFGDEYFFIPEIELTIDNGYYLKINYLSEDDIELNFSLSNNIFSSASVLKIEHNKTFNEWSRMINLAKKEFHSGKFKKIALSRETKITLSSNPDIDNIFNNLVIKNPSVFNFIFQINNETAFVGSTPELFYERKENKILCEALAGTLPRGKTIDEDKKLEEKLLKSQKNLIEHQFVVDGICNSLENIADNIKQVGTTKVRKTSTVQHLLQQLSAEINSNINEWNIIESLHPTPAVGTYPKNCDFSIISEIEKYNRGNYSAPIGYFNKEGALFTVALRCGLIKNSIVYLYSGAGIVEDSEPENEWEEINNKLLSFSQIFDDSKE